MMFAAIALSFFAIALPGYRTEPLGATAGFVSSLAVDSRGTLYYTTTAGTLFRFDAGLSTPIASVETTPNGNSGLLGMALIDDRTAVVHYTTPLQTHDVIARIDLTTGEETILHRFPCDIEVPERGSSSEHHGGNPHVAADGTIWVGIGDYGSSKLAALQQWNGGKIFRITPDGKAKQFAIGLRNPFDLFWDARNQRLVIADNGPLAGDEIHIVEENANLGWPITWGLEQQTPDTSKPDYVFSTTIAPTGMTQLREGGFLLGSYVTRAIYFFPDIDTLPLREPVAVIERETSSIIDVVQSATGDVFFATGNAIYRLIRPERGDCNGDGSTDIADIGALAKELADGENQLKTAVHKGNFPGAHGCDCNGDGLITQADTNELVRMLSWRRRGARH